MDERTSGCCHHTPRAVLTDGSDEELKDSFLYTFEPWQPRLARYYAVRISSDEQDRALPPVWSLVWVQAHEGDMVTLDLLFDPFRAYRDIHITEWIEMWRNGRHIMWENDAYRYGLINREIADKLKANRDISRMRVSVLNAVTVKNGRFYFGDNSRP